MTMLAADVAAPFWQGDPQHGDQGLYMQQPKEGLGCADGVFKGGLLPRQNKLRRIMESAALYDRSGEAAHFKQHTRWALPFT